MLTVVTVACMGNRSGDRRVGNLVHNSTLVWPTVIPGPSAPVTVAKNGNKRLPKQSLRVEGKRDI